MPRPTLRDLTARLELEVAETARLREANRHLQEQLRERTPRAAAPAAPRQPESHCPVCYQALTDMDTPLGCSHEFCLRCCETHFAAHDECPLCRAKASPKERWRYRHPRLASHWAKLRGHDWPQNGEFVLLTTQRDTLVGLLVETSDEKATMLLLYHSSAWEVALSDVRELFTIQFLAEQLAPREDGLLRVVSNA